MQEEAAAASRGNALSQAVFEKKVAEAIGSGLGFRNGLRILL
ncbi:hypothetical protein [Paraburkholderia unamae]|nr:hypothetical protein [Paraburkholderia unamae]